MPISFARHQFPPAIVRHAVWFYVRVSLSYRDVKVLLAERGLDVSYETVRRSVLKFGPLFAQELRRRRSRPTARWHLDEMALMIAGTQFWLWRAVDDEGDVLDLLVQRRRDKAAAVKLMRNLLKKQGFALDVLVTDKLRSYGAAKAELSLSARHEQACARTIGPRIPINQHDGGSARCSASNRRDQPNAFTGGASGIGYELTKQLTALGNTILITGRDQAKMDGAKAAYPKIHTFRSDVSDPKEIATLYGEVTKQFPELNFLINNAGVMREINVHDKAGSLEDITREIEINLSGPICMVKQFLPHLKTKSEAAIMNVSSGLAFVPLPISPVHSATKAGLHSFTESLRVQLKNTKVKVFELAPPATQTELLADFNFEDMKGVSIMKVEDMVRVAIKGMQTDRFEIRPGQANQLKMMSRLAPGFVLKQMSRSVAIGASGTRIAASQMQAGALDRIAYLRHIKLVD